MEHSLSDSHPTLTSIYWLRSDGPVPLMRRRRCAMYAGSIRATASGTRCPLAIQAIAWDIPERSDSATKPRAKNSVRILAARRMPWTGPGGRARGHRCRSRLLLRQLIYRVISRYGLRRGCPRKRHIRRPLWPLASLTGCGRCRISWRCSKPKNGG